MCGYIPSGRETIAARNSSIGDLLVAVLVFDRQTRSSGAAGRAIGINEREGAQGELGLPQRSAGATSRPWKGAGAEDVASSSRCLRVRSHGKI
jgi:hypothetical protein